MFFRNGWFSWDVLEEVITCEPLDVSVEDRHVLMSLYVQVVELLLLELALHFGHVVVYLPREEVRDYWVTL